MLRQSVKKYCGETKKTFAILKATTNNPPSPLNQCCKSREGEKIKNCTLFSNQQHCLKGDGGGGGIYPTIFLTDCSLFWICRNSMVLFSFSVFNRKYPFRANLVEKVKIVTFRRNLIPRVIPISRIQWCCSLFLFRPEILFWRKFGRKNEDYQFQLKFGTQNNSNMQNSMTMFTLSALDWKYPFWSNFF